MDERRDDTTFILVGATDGGMHMAGSSHAAVESSRRTEADVEEESRDKKHAGHR